MSGTARDSTATQHEARRSRKTPRFVDEKEVAAREIVERYTAEMAERYRVIFHNDKSSEDA